MRRFMRKTLFRVLGIGIRMASRETIIIRKSELSWDLENWKGDAINHRTKRNGTRIPAAV